MKNLKLLYNNFDPSFLSLLFTDFYYLLSSFSCHRYSEVLVVEKLQFIVFLAYRVTEGCSGVFSVSGLHPQADSDGRKLCHVPVDDVISSSTHREEKVYTINVVIGNMSTIDTYLTYRRIFLHLTTSY